jgi:drug/metabolite transporter (DMT)-like permease
MVTSAPLLAAYCLYGVNTLLLTLALRRGELSLLYPIISLTYVWVAILSVLLFQETINPIEGIGLATVVAGVAVLGLDGRRR